MPLTDVLNPVRLLDATRAERLLFRSTDRAVSLFVKGTPHGPAYRLVAGDETVADDLDVHQAVEAYNQTVEGLVPTYTLTA